MTATQDAFVWHDGFKLGYEPMDDTHHEFVAIVNDMMVCPETDLVSHLERFSIHAKRHFDEERAWMLETDFPSTGCHCDEHDAVMKSVTDVMASLQAGGDVRVARDLAQALADWFPGHADYLDSALAHWIVKKRTGGVPIVLRRNST